MAVIYEQIKNQKFVSYIEHIFILVYVIAIFIPLICCGYKQGMEKWKKSKFVLSEKTATPYLFIVVFSSVFVYSISLNREFSVKDSNMTSIIIAVISLTVSFFAILILLFKAFRYLTGLSNRVWRYVLSPTPEGIEKKHLYVLYSINPNILVLSDDPHSEANPTSVYLYDMSKDTYTHFNRVLLDIK